MAKHNCAICGAEVGLISAQKLADGNYICRKNCRSQLFPCFESMHATLDEVKAHNEALKAENEKLMDDSYIEKLARENLGMTKQGEMPYIYSQDK